MKHFIIIMALIIMGCADDPDCSQAISDTIRQYGSTDDISTVSLGENITQTYRYHCQGVDYVFTWGKDYWECQVTTREYEPACQGDE